VAVWALEAAGVAFGAGYTLVLAAVSLALGALLLWGLDRNRVIGGSASRQRAVWRRDAARARGEA